MYLGFPSLKVGGDDFFIRLKEVVFRKGLKLSAAYEMFPVSWWTESKSKSFFNWNFQSCARICWGMTGMEFACVLYLQMSACALHMFMCTYVRSTYEYLCTFCSINMCVRVSLLRWKERYDDNLLLLNVTDESTNQANILPLTVSGTVVTWLFFRLL